MSRSEPVDQWLGSVPENWKVLRLRHVLARNDGGVWGEDGSAEDTIVLRSTEQTEDGRWRIEDPARRKLSAQEEANARLRSGDLVITKSSGSARHIGKTSLVDERVAALDCCFSNFMQRLAVRTPHDPRYFWYFLNDPAGREQLFYRSSTTTGLANLNGSILGSVVAPVPAPEAQRAIASFLDRETARIDTLIEKKRRLLNLLEEKRTALITRAVTQGLNPDVPMKDSGVEWIGEIPMHWEVRRLRHLCRITTGGRDTQDAEEHGNYPFVVRSDHLERISTYSFEGEGVLTSGDGAGVGKIFHHMNGRFDFHQRVYLFHSFRDITGRFLYHYIRPNLGRVVLPISAKSTVDSLRRPMLLDFAVAIPPLSEQITITSELDRIESQIRQTRQKVTAAVDLLREYRTALISAAVTGRIDVTERALTPA